MIIGFYILFLEQKNAGVRDSITIHNLSAFIYDFPPFFLYVHFHSSLNRRFLGALADFQYSYSFFDMKTNIWMFVDHFQ